MKTAEFTRRPALASGIATAVLVVFAAAPAVAGHGYAMNHHPLRGDFPTTSQEAVAETHGAAVAEARPRSRQAGDRDHWLRGDFPTAAESRSEAGQTTAEADDIELKAALTIPGATTLRLEQHTLEPGATINSTTMKTAFVCEMVQGEVESVIDGVSITRNNGDVWTCPMQHGDALHTNSGAKQAIMRVIHLIP